ncbi:polysaccharide deacetylase family protein [Phaeobacter marinintestinus]|uniref:polysaccharide deacetylase family protein n=1 Tax=Falsiphaeobacter marinintestinus TaxID=1492905 RepID=UPI0011B6AA49|nr:polysaccharide deacetylase family protein [Phaeobacter marinintestinus]
MVQTPPFTDNVVIFHGIGTPGRRLEPGEDVYWLTRSDFRDVLDQIVAMGPDRPEITFDDGNASDAEIALPELNARGLKATFFVLTNRLGRPGALAERDVAAMAQAGHQIGLHGHSHLDWRRLNQAGRIAEFRTARQTLEALSGSEITKAAAPFGYYDRAVISHLISEGFSALYTSDYGRVRQGNFIRPRNCIEAGLSPEEMTRVLTGKVAPFRKPRRLVGIVRKRLWPVRRIP